MKEGKTCKICSKTFTRRNYMLKHMEHMHSKKFSCPKCSRFFSCPKEHSCAVENGRFLCYVRGCSLRFSNGISMRLHIRDCHRQLDEEGVGGAIKTKKGIQELVQFLCKKINLLSNCFDELKYEVDTIAGLLSSKDYSTKNDQLAISKPETENEKVFQDTTEPEMQEYENIDYIDEEYEDEETFEDIKDINMILDSPIDSGNTIRTQNSAENCGIQLLSHSIEEPTIEPKSVTSTSLNPVAARSSELIIGNSSKTSIFMPQKPTIGSTIITPLAAKLISLPHSNVKNNASITSVSGLNVIGSLRKPSATIMTASSTPPLFLKIQYDQGTAVCTNDPKITYHFDTRPLEDGGQG